MFGGVCQPKKISGSLKIRLQFSLQSHFATIFRQPAVFQSHKNVYYTYIDECESSFLQKFTFSKPRWVRILTYFNTKRHPQFIMRKSKIESLKTRHYLMSAALEVFYRQGITRSTLQEIAEEAGVTRGALYWHFKNKEDLFSAMFETFFADILTRFNEQAINQADDVWQYLRDNLRAIMHNLQHDELHQKFCCVINVKCERTPHNQAIVQLAERYHEMLSNQIIAVVKIGHEQKKLPENIDLDLATLYLRTNLAGLIRIWADSDCAFNLLEASDSVIDTALYALQHSPYLRQKA